MAAPSSQHGAPPRAELINRVRRAHAELVEHVAGLGPPYADPAIASALPGWTRGHVLTHIARNADSFVGMLRGAEIGERRHQYEGGAEGRAAAIETGAGRSWADLVDDVGRSASRLDAQFLSQQRWDGEGVGIDGSAAVIAELPFRRWREVLVHRTDLGDAGFTADDWPAEYVRQELRLLTMRWNARRPMGATGLPAAALAAPPTERLLWLMGRVEIPGLDPAGVFG
jgi:maleylpyruvate isomerase